MAATKSWQQKPVLPQANLVTNIPTQDSKLDQTVGGSLTGYLQVTTNQSYIRRVSTSGSTFCNIQKLSQLFFVAHEMI